MFNEKLEERLSIWFQLRRELETHQTPFERLIEFWLDAPMVAYDLNLDHNYNYSWPTPWEIIEKNQYDDFTKSVMMGHSLKLTERFKDALLQVTSIVDSEDKMLYHCLIVNDEIVLNFKDDRPITKNEIPIDYKIINTIQFN